MISNRDISPPFLLLARIARINVHSRVDGNLGTCKVRIKIARSRLLAPPCLLTAGVPRAILDEAGSEER